MRILTGPFHRVHMKIADSRFYDWLSSPRVRGLHVKVGSLPRPVAEHLGTRGLAIPRSLSIPELPESLKTYPGIPLDRAKQEEAFERDGPLPLWTQVHSEAMVALRHGQWMLDMFTIPRRNRENVLVAKVRKQRLGVKPAVDNAELSRMVKAKAAEIGLSAVGFAKRDPLMTYAPYQDRTPEGDTVIICIAEQHYGATQTIPSFRAELAHYDTYMKEFPAHLAAYIRELGYVANVYGEHGMNIAYAVQAGLGQLGLNGLLLSPFAGPRLRLHMILTNAPLVFDKPVDYGVPALCDQCKSCVRNCPSGAIRSKREWHRGVYKAKIKTERCIPIVVQAHGCGVCMKVCPVQRYGLPAMIDEFKRSGKILGKGTDELEGYVWPFDGKYYGPGKKPPEAITEKILHPPGFIFDPTRTKPIDGGATVPETGGVLVAKSRRSKDEAEEPIETMPLM